MSNFIEPTIKTPFSSLYPRMNRFHAIQALKQLGNSFSVIDCETTGVGKSGEVIELAIVDYQSSLPLFHSLIRPIELEKYRGSKAQEINGISPDELTEAPTICQAWPDILKALKSQHVTAYNADFDIRLIRNSVLKWGTGIDIPVLEATCIMKLATAWLNMDFWPSLDECAAIFQVEKTNSHRALGDVIITIGIIKAMKAGK